MAWRAAPEQEATYTSAGLPPGPPGPPGDRDVARGVGAVVEGILSGIRRFAGASLSAVAETVEMPSRALTQRVAAQAVAHPRPVADPGALAAALARGPAGPMLGGAAAAAFASRMARRFRRLGFLARRTPLWVLAAAVPALHASVTRGAEEVGLVASHLVHRARAAGIEPDPERVRRAAIQVMSDAGVDPNQEPRHVVLVAVWLRRAVRTTLPLPGGGTRDPEGIVRRAVAVPPASLGPPYVTSAR